MLGRWMSEKGSEDVCSEYFFCFVYIHISISPLCLFYLH